MTTLWIGLGGALGSIGRHQLSSWLQERLGTGFPYGTVAVNLIGSFLLALLMQLDLRPDILPPELRVPLATGVLGGFTTYSTFNYDTLRLFQTGAWGLGTLNLVGTVLGCLIAGVGGWAVGRALGGA